MIHGILWLSVWAVGLAGTLTLSILALLAAEEWQERRQDREESLRESQERVSGHD